MKFLYIVAFLVTSLSAQDEFSSTESTLGGYGELHLNINTPENGKTTATADFHRFVLFYGFAFNDTWSLKAEVELEHNFVKDGHGELELEQAFINYHLNDAFNYKLGVILAPVGYINETHEPPTFNGLERPSFDNIIIPTTWFDNGFSFYGLINEQYAYNVSILGGLNGDGIESSGLRGSRTKGYKSAIKGNFNNPTFIFRFDYIIEDFFDIGFSLTKNSAKVSDIALNYKSIPVNNSEFHSKFYYENFQAKLQYGINSFGNISYDKQEGSLFEFAYHYSYDDAIITPFIRYEDINKFKGHNDSEVEKSNHLNIITFGISYKPISQIVFKLDYMLQENASKNSSKSENLAMGVGYNF